MTMMSLCEREAVGGRQDSYWIGQRTDEQYDFPFSRQYLQTVEPEKAYTLSRKYKAPAPAPAPAPDKPSAIAGEAMDEEAMLNAMSAEEAAANDNNDDNNVKGVVAGESEAMDVPMRPEEKKRLDWRDDLYLAPLTTVGNLVRLVSCTLAPMTRLKPSRQIPMFASSFLGENATRLIYSHSAGYARPSAPV